MTPAGLARFERMGLDVASIKPTRRGLARQCLDWTERRHHLAGTMEPVEQPTTAVSQ